MENASAEKQGIVVVILGTDEGREKVRPSLRRTLSADMSSKKWAAQNGICPSNPMKKIASSKDLRFNPILDSFSSSEDEEEEDDESRIKNEFDVWNSIISQSRSADKSLPPPYVHPLVKRSASSLSEKSLQICTESLGSETGSDSFSSRDAEVEFRKDMDSDAEKEVEEEESGALTFGSVRKLAAARPFPPPLPSLSSRRGGDCGPTLQILSHRDSGRLVVEAVTVPPLHPNFAAQRLDGRLVLKFAQTYHQEPKNDEAEEFEEQFASETETGTEQEEVAKAVHEEVRKKIGNNAESSLINFHRLALMTNKSILPNMKSPPSSWREEYSEFQQQQENQDKPSQLAMSLPLRPLGPVGRLIPPRASAKVSTTAAASFNHYDYFWRTKINDSNDNELVFKNPATENDKRELVVLRGNSYLVPLRCH